jgi:phasin family protein
MERPVMSNQITDSLKDQSAKMLAPALELNKLAIAKLEQLTALQLGSLRDYAELNFGQLKAASSIASPEDLKDYLGKQKEFLRTLGEKLAADSQALAALGKEFTEEARKVTMMGFPGKS